ncbi:MAG: hypothetical protein ACTSRS_21100 [Candidatus Helarchaeota archaeon]
MRKGKIFMIIVVFGVILPFSNFGIEFYLYYNILPPYEKILLDRFPISLEILFQNNSPVEQAQRLDNIRNGGLGGTDFFLTPYPNYFHPYHAPATFKWYLVAKEHIQVTIPVDSYFVIQMMRDNEIKEINGTLMRMDLSVDLHLNFYIKINLDHVCINETIVEEWESVEERFLFGHSHFDMHIKYVFIPANTIIGYTSENGMDFTIHDKSHYNYDTNFERPLGLHKVNPFFYFTPEVQEELRTYYQLQLNAMEESGLYPESRLNRTFDINEKNTIFGTWFYKEGFLELNETHHEDIWYNFDGGVINMLNVNKTDRDTFYKDQYKGGNFSNEMVGVFYDSDAVDVDGYPLIGAKYMYNIGVGNFQEGVIRLDNFTMNIRPMSLYMKYKLVENGPSMYDDILYVDYYQNLTQALGSFTDHMLTYERIYTH